MQAETRSPEALQTARDERSFQCILRPLVDKAWKHHCARFQITEQHAIEKESWYRDILFSVIGQRTSKGLESEQRRALVRHFNMLANLDSPVAQYQVLTINGWSPKQCDNFTKLARKAWSRERMRGVATAFDEWWPDQFEKSCDITPPAGPSNTNGFDMVMAWFAAIANDDYWMRRTSQGPEGRMRFQIRRFMQDLAFLEQRPVDWNYVLAIWHQTQMLPDLEDATADQLAKVLAMLDTHIRRLCERRGIRPVNLPTRCGHDAMQPVTQEAPLPF